MIAPYGRAGKRPDRISMSRVRRPRTPHRFVKDIIKPPNFGQARAKLDWETLIVASGPGLLPSAGFLSPPAPRGLEWIGPEKLQNEFEFQLLSSDL